MQPADRFNNGPGRMDIGTAATCHSTKRDIGQFHSFSSWAVAST
jgi:hypothetical protein